jgi:hypothetical protein
MPDAITKLFVRCHVKIVVALSRSWKSLSYQLQLV